MRSPPSCRRRRPSGASPHRMPLHPPPMASIPLAAATCARSSRSLVSLGGGEECGARGVTARLCVCVRVCAREHAPPRLRTRGMPRRLRAACAGLCQVLAQHPGIPPVAGGVPCRPIPVSVLPDLHIPVSLLPWSSLRASRSSTAGAPPAHPPLPRAAREREPIHASDRTVGGHLRPARLLSVCAVRPCGARGGSSPRVSSLCASVGSARVPTLPRACTRAPVAASAPVRAVGLLFNEQGTIRRV